MFETLYDYIRRGWRWFRRGIHRAVLCALWVAPLAVIAWRGWAKRWISDDGFINLRIVRNFLDGFGPVYNVAERVEAYTSTLWVAILSLLGALGIRLEDAAVVAGVGLTLAGLLAAQWAAVRWISAPGESQWETMVHRWVVPLGTGLYVALPVAWDYATSGLETGLALAWIGVSAACVAIVVDGSVVADGSEHAPSDDLRLSRWWWVASVVVGLAPLVRPGLTLFSFGWVVPMTVAWWGAVGKRASWRRRGIDVTSSLAAGLALPVVYEVFRLGYFGTPVPNTALAKTAFTPHWQQGWYYAEHFFGLFHFSVPLGVAVALAMYQCVRHGEDGKWARAAWGWAPVVSGAVYSLYIVRIGGGFMYGRLFLPAVFGMLVPVAGFSLRQPGRAANAEGEPSRAVIQPFNWGSIAGRVGLFVVLAGWMVACATLLRVPEANYKGIGDERGWYAAQAQTETPVRIEEYYKHPFHRSARQLKRRAAEVCPAETQDPVGPLDRGESVDWGTCDKAIVYPDKPQTTEFGRLFPNHRTYPLQERFKRRGVQLTAMRTAIGIRGYVLGRRVHLVDHVGLADPLAARLEGSHRNRPGHRKALTNPWMVARFADERRVEDYRVTAARQALDCAPLSTLDRAVTAPLTVGQFVANVGDAWTLWGLRLPRDPIDARERFCGTRPAERMVSGGPGGKSHRWRCPVGYTMSGVRAAGSAGSNAIGFIRPICSADAPEEVPDNLETVRGPRLGGGASGTPVTVSCEEGERLVGLRGKSDTFVRQLASICQTQDDPPTGSTEAKGETPRHTSVGFDRGDSFELRCSDGSPPVGIAGSTGTLVDAAGILCD